MHDHDSIRAIERTPLDALTSSSCETIRLADGGLVRLVPGFIDAKLANNLYNWLRRDVPWEQMKFRGRVEPRLTCWMGGFSYRYSGVTRRPVPWLPIVQGVAATVEKLIFSRAEDQFQGVLLNYYRTGQDKIGLHSDAEPDLLPGAPIASLSLGAMRRFVLRHNRSREKVVVPLMHGSLLVMEGTTQEHWKHEILAEPRCSDGRINLTMRRHTVGVAR